MSQVLNGDFSMIRQELEELSNTSGTGRGMRLSVWCAEESPFVSKQKIEAEKNKYPAIKGLNPVTVNPDICTLWGVKSLNEKANQAISSTIPTLILNGEYDETTPVKWGAMLHENLPNSFHFVFKGYKHGITTYWDNSCGMNVANAFLNDPKKKPELECFKEIKTPKFRVK
ncbi:MAG: alpha/beta hydrolase, partial [Bacteroidota bacterium]